MTGHISDIRHQNRWWRGRIGYVGNKRYGNRGLSDGNGKVLFERYRLQMYSYLNRSLHSGQLESIIGFPFANQVITRDVCAFRSVNYWRIDRLNFWADVSVTNSPI